MAAIARILALLAASEKMIAGLCIGGLTIIMFADVGAREVFKEGISWAQKISLHLMFWGGMLGVAVVSAKGAHLRPEIGEKLWPKKLKPVLKTLEHLLIAAFCATMAVVSVNFVLESNASGQRHPVTDIPLWILQMVLPYVFVSMTLRHVAYALLPSIRPADVNEAEEALALEKEAQAQEGDKA
jgi:TRAP-type C4-dicarboxylate transport system permease small subunit